MFRRLPILLIIFMMATSARAEQGFFDQFFGSLKNNGSSASESAGDVTGATTAESEPLALQPTTTRAHPRKRYHASHRHHPVAPAQDSDARPGAESAVRDKSAPEASPEKPSALPEPADDSKPVEDVRPTAENSNADSPPVSWPSSPPAELAAWPGSTPADGAQSETVNNNDNMQSAPTADESAAVRQDTTATTEAVEQAESDSFLDPQRLVLGGFSAAWLVLGIVMFAFRRRLARTIVAFEQRRSPPGPATVPRASSSPQLRLILKNAASDSDRADLTSREQQIASVG